MTQPASPVISPPMAHRIYDILVHGCQARESQRADFVQAVGEKPEGEWRFGGSLGPGGKFWWDVEENRFFVSCYVEDETVMRAKTIREVNEKLARAVATQPHRPTRPTRPTST